MSWKLNLSSPTSTATLTLTLTGPQVHYIHNRGVVHRDLKLENFLLDTPQEVDVNDQNSMSPKVGQSTNSTGDDVSGHMHFFVTTVPIRQTKTQIANKHLSDSILAGLSLSVARAFLSCAFSLVPPLVPATCALVPRSSETTGLFLLLDLAPIGELREADRLRPFEALPLQRGHVTTGNECSLLGRHTISGTAYKKMCVDTNRVTLVGEA